MSVCRMTRPVFTMVLTTCVVLAASGAGSPGAAEAFRVKLKNGNEFLSRYEPIEASYDANKWLVMTDAGNVVALAKEDVLETVFDNDAKGFGKRINVNTVEIGIGANDMVDPAMLEETLRQGGINPALLQRLNSSQPIAQPVYNRPLVTEPGGLGGLPLSWATSGSVPIGAPITNN